MAIRTSKSALRSKTLWGVVLMLLPIVARSLGIEWPAEINPVLEAAVNELLTVGGAGLAVYGRLKADTQLHRPLKKNP